MKAKINNTSSELLVAEFEEEEEKLRTKENQTSSGQNNELVGKESKSDVSSDIDENSNADDEM